MMDRVKTARKAINLKRKVLDESITFKLNIKTQPNPIHEKWVSNFFGGKVRQIDNVLYVKHNIKSKGNKILIIFAYNVLHYPLMAILRLKSIGNIFKNFKRKNKIFK